MTQPIEPTALDLRAWIGRREELSDTITPVPAAALSATLDHEPRPWLPADSLPPLWHWLYLLPLAPQHELGPDGHPQRGGFLPPVALPRRMWAGGRFEFSEPLAIGDTVTRVSRIVDLSEKTGRSGMLVFVRVLHEIWRHTPTGRRLALTEEHDIVYRDAPAKEVPSSREEPASVQLGDFQRSIDPTPVLLFRFSALTFNGHRIHYDRRYCEREEGYPGLVVHGPLQALLLLDLVQRHQPDALISRYAFRAVRPLFDGAPFRVCGRHVDDGHSVALWTLDAQGHMTVEATAELA